MQAGFGKTMGRGSVRHWLGGALLAAALSLATAPGLARDTLTIGLSQFPGTLHPSIEQRTQWFFDTWRDWREFAAELDTKNPEGFAQIKNHLKTLGIREHTDYLLQNGRKSTLIRFCSADTLALALLSIPNIRADYV
jgi:hypothetical protein